MTTSAQAQVSIPNITRAGMAQRNLVDDNVPLQDCKDTADLTELPTAGNATVFGLVSGTHGSAGPMLKSADLKTLGSVSRTFRLVRALLPIYYDGETVTVQVKCRITNAADTTATLQLDARKKDGEGSIGSDLYGGSAVDVNDDTQWTSVQFDLTTTSLVGGDMLDLEFTFACNDGAGASEVALQIGEVRIRQDCRP